jgi:lipopolysaccharide transport system permease protein
MRADPAIGLTRPASTGHGPVVLAPERSLSVLDLRSLWQQRELLYFLTLRDIKLRYRQTFLGVAWAVLQPLAAMLIFSLFLGRVAGVTASGIPYPLFAFTGLVPWMFFSNALNGASSSLLSSSNLITKVYFPRIIIPSAAVFAGLVDFAVSFVLLAVLLAHYRVPLSAGVVMVPLLLALLTLLALGVGTWMAALNVKYRDIRYALPFVVQLWMFASPVVYPVTLVPERWRWLVRLNPVSGIVEGFRSALLGHGPFDWSGLGTAAIGTVLVLFCGLSAFSRMEESFADVI